MPKYFVENPPNGLSGETIHHLKRVLRVRVGDEVILCDGAGMDYLSKVESLEPFRLKVVEPRRCLTEPRCKVTLYQAMAKSDKMDWIVQKAVELGVCSVVPVFTEFSVAKKAKTERYQKIAESAAGQSMRGIIPQVQQAVDFADIVKGGGFNIAPHPYAKPTIKQLTGLPDEVNLWIGPEGGFSPGEAEAMAAAGFHLVSLGARILRTETAALAALTQIFMVTE